MAREYSHATGAAFRDPGTGHDAAVSRTPSGFPIAVDDRAPIRGRAGASEFVARIVRDVDPSRPTPPWMITRLSLAGIRSLGVLIDITNTSCSSSASRSTATTSTACRAASPCAARSRARSSRPSTAKVRTLNAEDLLITDESGPIGLAGVMGGGPTEMSDATRNVLIEAATFDQVTIARTARRHKLPSEASRRFERGVDPLVPYVAAERVASLMVELAAARSTPISAAPSPRRTAVSPSPCPPDSCRG